MKKAVSKGISAVKNKIADHILPEDVAIDGYLYIADKKYEIQNFEIEFQQEEDYKGRPQHEVKGGLISVTLKQTSDNVLNRWMFQRSVAYSGSVVFAPISRIATPPLTIVFEEGRCISFEKMITSNVGIQVSIVISAKKLIVNGIEYTNHPYL